MRLRASLIPAVLSSLSALAAAQQIPVFEDQVVVTATGDAQPSDQVPAATAVIRGSELQAMGVTSLAAALAWTPGVTVLRSGQDGGVTSLFTRGTSSTHTLVMYDGVKLNSPFFGGYDWSVPLAFGLDRVEIVRGPYSALYGADAIGGVVQMFPTVAQGDRLSAVVESGTDDWRRAEIEGTAAGDGWAAVVAGGSRDGDGPLVNDGFSSRSGLASVTASLGETARIGALLHRTTSFAEIPFSGAVTTPHRSTSEGETIAAVPFHWRFVPDGELEVTLSRTWRDLAYSDPDDPTGFVHSDTAADTDDVRVVVRRRWTSHALALGAEWQGDRVTDESSYGVNLDDTRRTTRSLSVQDNWTPAGPLSVLLGARWDESSPWGTELSPRAAVSWNTAGWRAWASFGRAFRAPSLGELYYPYAGNPALSPERSRSAEAGVLLRVSGAGEIQFVGFSNRQSDLIDFDYATFTYANIDRARQDGLEISWATAVGDRGHLTSALTWLKARDGSGQPLLRRPEWAGSVTVAGPLVRSLEGAASIVWVGSRTDLDPVSYARVPQGGFVTANAAATLPLGRGIAARARVENLADREYEPIRGYPAPRRRFFLGVTALLH